MVLWNFAVELSFTVDLNSLVQVLLDNANSLVKIAQAYLVYVKATKLAKSK